MSSKEESPIVSLQTLVLAIQVIDWEVSKVEELYKQHLENPNQELWTADDDTWRYDLDLAAENLKEVYLFKTKEGNIINFPEYVNLIGNNKKS